MLGKALVGAGLALALTTAASAEAAEVCAPPIGPPPQSQRPIRPVEPPLPACINPVSHLSSCRPAVLKAANASVDAYNASLEVYATAAHAYNRALEAYVDSAQAYANCEVRVMNARP